MTCCRQQQPNSVCSANDFGCSWDLMPAEAEAASREHGEMRTILSNGEKEETPAALMILSSRTSEDDAVDATIVVTGVSPDPEVIVFDQSGVVEVAVSGDLTKVVLDVAVSPSSPSSDLPAVEAVVAEVEAAPLERAVAVLAVN